jgi:hypothetical protein
MVITRIFQGLYHPNFKKGTTGLFTTILAIQKASQVSEESFN